MGRRPRSRSRPCCYHITQRCQERRFLLKFAIDRRNYVRRLYYFSRTSPVSVLNYMVTSNHVHLLLWSKQAKDISVLLRDLQGNTARDYNRRKGREGALWSGRYHPTLIENGKHLGRCLFYLDLNMVRARACEHPREWDACGYHELSGQRQRYQVIDQVRLARCLGHPSTAGFRQWYENTLTEKLSRAESEREPYWSKALAVGSIGWIKSMGIKLDVTGSSRILIEPLVDKDGDSADQYGVFVSARTQGDFWQKLHD